MSKANYCSKQQNNRKIQRSTTYDRHLRAEAKTSIGRYTVIDELTSLRVKLSKRPKLRRPPPFVNFTSRSPTRVSQKRLKKKKIPLYFQQEKDKVNILKYAKISLFLPGPTFKRNSLTKG